MAHKQLSPAVVLQTAATIAIREVDAIVAPTSHGEPRQLHATSPNSTLAQPDSPPVSSATVRSALRTAPDAHPAGAWRVPVPLLAPRPDVAAEAPGPDVSFVAAGTGRATEVHVHIARVELTAVPAPSPKPHRNVPTERPGRSLDDYLQHRKERLR